MPDCLHEEVILSQAVNPIEGGMFLVRIKLQCDRCKIDFEFKDECAIDESRLIFQIATQPQSGHAKNILSSSAN